MGDMGIIRRAPSGWLAGTCASQGHAAVSYTDPEGGGTSEIETSMDLTVTWLVHVAGREPYEVAERRKAPMWVVGTSIGGQGKRWYKLRLSRSWGLLKDVAMPCAVDPDDPQRIWVDWDAGFDAHESPWRVHSEAQKGIAERTSRFDGMFKRLVDPFAGELSADEKQQAEQKVDAWEADQERIRAESVAAAQNAQWAGVDPADKARFDAWAAELDRISQIGERHEGQLVQLTDTGETMIGLPVRRLEIRLDDGRTVAAQVPLHQRMAKRYTPGTRVVVRIDPEEPGLVAVVRE